MTSGHCGRELDVWESIILIVRVYLLTINKLLIFCTYPELPFRCLNISFLSLKVSLHESWLNDLWSLWKRA